MTNCKLCGEPMPEGEEMFNYHGYSGPCPKPPLPRETVVNKREEMIEIIAIRLAKQSGTGGQANPVGPYYRALAEEIVNDLAGFFPARTALAQARKG